VRRVIAKGGPHAWQTARCALDAVRALARRKSDAISDCIEACLERVPPGVVAARDASAGLVAGHAMFRPPWLVFRTVHPLEVLVLQSALDRETPRWTAPSLA